MKSYRLYGIEDYRIEDIEEPLVQSGEVLVKVKAAGICGSDIPRIYKTGAYHHPMTPGHEFSGVVEAIGRDVSEKWKGKRVGIFPLIPCMECSSCKKRMYEMCKHYNYLGSRTDGGFSEYVKVPEWNLMEIPANVTFEQAAMLEPMAVAVHALRKSGLLEGMEDKEKSIMKESFVIDGKYLPNHDKNIAVCGLGTIGLLIVMFLKGLGYKNVYACGNKSFQFENAYKFGVVHENCCDVRSENVLNWFADKTSGEGVDIFFECVGKNEVIDQGLSCLSAGGTLLLVGNPTCDVLLEKASYWKILRQQIKVQGTWNSSYTHEVDDDWHYVIDCLKDGIINPEVMITHRYNIDGLMRGFELMRDKSEDYVKVMGIF